MFTSNTCVILFICFLLIHLELIAVYAMRCGLHLSFEMAISQQYHLFKRPAFLGTY